MVRKLSYIRNEEIMSKQNTKISPVVLFEDEHFVVMNKPAGLLSIPDRFMKDLPNMFNILEQQYGEIFIVHRLDKETSGAILFAKNAEAHQLLNGLFREGKVHKKYLALVTGRMQQKEGEIDIPLSSHPSKPGTVVPDYKHGKPAVSSYKVVEEFLSYTLAEVVIHTGKMHQIRVHMQAIGHPLAIDRLYGSSTNIKLSDFKRNYRAKKEVEEKPLMSRLTLHALQLAFSHPFTGKDIHIEAPLPKDFSVLLKQLRKYGK